MVNSVLKNILFTTESVFGSQFLSRGTGNAIDIWCAVLSSAERYIAIYTLFFRLFVVCLSTPETSNSYTAIQFSSAEP